MRFEWDPQKALLNLRKHKVSFDEAVSVFFDVMAKVTYDPDHSEDEHRQILIGHSSNKKLLFVIHISFEDKNIIRIVSARRATKKERKDFENI